MNVLGVLSRKGGVGKTTLATHAAVLAEQAGLRALLIDLDPQRSAGHWWRLRDAQTPRLAETSPGELRDVLEAAAEGGIDLAVIDARPSVEVDVAYVASLADLVLVPTKPAVFDLRAILDTLDIVRNAAKRALIALNDCPPARGAGEASVVVDARKALAAFGVPVAPIAIVHRSAFPAAALAGMATCEFEPDGKAAKETRALWRAVEKEMNHNGKAHAGKHPGDERRARDGRSGATANGREAAEGA
jgi:chromosome partitioning protein